jgi:hypothetical protein
LSNLLREIIDQSGITGKVQWESVAA